MTSRIEERLRRAVHEEASTTTTSADAWDRIAVGLGGRGTAHRSRLPRALVAATALGLLTVVVATALRLDGTTQVQVADQPGRLYLVPQDAGRFRLVSAVTDPEVDAASPHPRVRAFGRRAADGVTFAALAVVTIPPDRLLDGAFPEDEALPGTGEALVVHRDHYGRRFLVWRQDDGQEVGLTTFGLSDVELTELVASLRTGPAESATPVLPSGFSDLDPGARLANPPRFTDQTWEGEGGERFSLVVSEVDGLTLDDLAAQSPGGRAVEVRGTTGVFSDRDGNVLMWIARPGTVATIMSMELPLEELRSIADNLQAVDEPTWRALAATAESGRPDATGGVREVVPVEPPTAADGNSFFVLQPVLRRSPAPCVGSQLAVAGAGEDVACYELGPPGLVADDVVRAGARPDPGSGTWQVEFALSSQGAARFRALAEAVGVGGQVAVVVDGRVVAAPTVATLAMTAVGVVSGLDEDAARNLAERLGG